MHDHQASLLSGRSFPELADVVRAATQDVAAAWETIVQATLPHAHELTRRQVRDNLVGVLGFIAEALAGTTHQPVEQLLFQSLEHGETRFDQKFELGELMIEYGLLRRVLLEKVAERLGRDLHLPEIEALAAGVDVATRRGVTVFAEQQRAELKAVVGAQTKYLSFLSHDLRGGLNGVLLMIEVLRRDLAKHQEFASSLEDLEVMRRSILETVGTMDRFLHAERFRRGKVQLKPAPLKLASLSHDVTGQFSYVARDRGVTLEVDLSGAGELVSDREMIVMILQNLLSNAIKYSGKGTVRVSATTQGLPPDTACRMTVSDQGPGIPPEKLTGLFRSFTRGDTHGQPGTGLGLSIARQAADLLGARLWAESTVGQGSQFHLDLPRTPPEQKPPPQDDA